MIFQTRGSYAAGIVAMIAYFIASSLAIKKSHGQTSMRAPEMHFS
jgi:hypothetical protein